MKFIFSLGFFLLVNCIFGQTQLTGKVTDSINKPLEGISVILKSDSTAIITYSYTLKDGSYSLKTNKTGNLELIVSSLGYEKKSIPVKIGIGQKNLNVNVVLKESQMSLDEVVINAERPISVKNDTIVFKTKYFTNGTEETVEDLLKKIPGLNIDSEGNIKVGNQGIEKIMVEGDDFFGKGYKILSKNMPAYPIEEVEVLKHYSNNRLLKGIENSDKIALNLKLDEKSKRVWFGNLEGQLGNDSYYDFKGNLMNFGKKNKYYFLTNLNNIGYDATGDIQNLIRPSRANEPGRIGDGQHVDNLFSLSVFVPNFKESRTNFNNAKLVSLNAIFNPTENLKIKTLAFFNSDENNFYKNTIDQVNTNNASFTNRTDYKLRKKKKIAFGKIDATYKISKTENLESTTKYNYANHKDGSNLVFNSASTKENLEYRNNLFDQNVTYTNKFNEKKVLLLTSRFIHEETPQDYRLNRFFYEDLFPENSNTKNVGQKVSNQMHYFGVNAHLLDRKTNDNLLELQIGNEFRKDKLTTVFSLLKGETLLNRPEAYQNQTVYQVNDLYAKGKYRYKFNDFAIIGKLDIHQLFNKLKNKGDTDNQNPFFVNPSLGFDWKINNKNKLKVNYSNNTTNAKLLDVYGNFALTGFRSFLKGTGNFNQLNASSVSMNYQFGNWSDRFFANAYVVYNKNHDFFSTNTQIEQNYSQAEKIVIKDRELFFVNSNFDYYFKSISSSLKLDLGFTESEFKNVVNNSDLRVITSYNYSYSLQLRSGFNGIFNYHIGSKWTSHKVKTNPSTSNSYTNNRTFLDLYFVFSKKFDVTLMSERYSFGNIETDNTYYFLDVKANYDLIKNTLSFSLMANNLFNTEAFKSVSISDIGTTTTEYRLLPRMVLLGAKWRF